MQNNHIKTSVSTGCGYSEEHNKIGYIHIVHHRGKTLFADIQLNKKKMLKHHFLALESKIVGITFPGSLLMYETTVRPVLQLSNWGGNLFGEGAITANKILNFF